MTAALSSTGNSVAVTAILRSLPMRFALPLSPDPLHPGGVAAIGDEVATAFVLDGDDRGLSGRTGDLEQHRLDPLAAGPAARDLVPESCCEVGHVPDDGTYGGGPLTDPPMQLPGPAESSRRGAAGTLRVRGAE